VRTHRRRIRDESSAGDGVECLLLCLRQVRASRVVEDAAGMIPKGNVRRGKGERG
jgi:hypothetical protein